MDADAILTGAVLGGTGGVLAGLSMAGARFLLEWVIFNSHRRRIRKWLAADARENGEGWRTTIHIASRVNLDRNRVEQLCAHDRRIQVAEDDWGNWRLDQNRPRNLRRWHSSSSAARAEGE